MTDLNRYIDPSRPFISGSITVGLSSYPEPDELNAFTAVLVPEIGSDSGIRTASGKSPKDAVDGLASLLSWSWLDQLSST